MNWEPTGKSGGAPTGKKRRGCLVAVAVVAVLLVAVGVSRCLGGGSGDALEWPSNGLAAMLPKPDSAEGTIIINDSERLSVSVDGYTQEKFDSYVAQCQERGFAVEATTDTDEFDAYTEDGHHLTLHFYDSLENMDIDLEAPVEMGSLAWPTAGAGALVPAPTSTTGKIDTDSSTTFSAYVGETSRDDYATYVEACIEAGFSVDYNKTDDTFSADSADGAHLSADYLGNSTMKVTVSAPDGSGSESASAEVEQTEAEEPAGSTSESVSDASGVDPDLKATLDAYESFINEYIDFMATYNSDPDNVVSMLTEYNDMLQEYSDFAGTIDAIDEGSLSGADLQYYLDVTARVNQRLLEIGL